MSSGWIMTETEFRKCALVRLGMSPGHRVWAQNNGVIPIKDSRGRTDRAFDTGIPNGAADISGIVIPEGWRIEIELKGPKTRVTADQLNWENRMVEFGCVYVRYRIDAKRSLDENLDQLAYELDVAIELKRKGQIVSKDCACTSCKIVRQA